MVPDADRRASRRHWLLLTLALTARARAQPSCDPGLSAAAADPLGYRAREDRCEGRYVQEVAGSPLTLASFAEPFGALGRSAEGALALAWPPPPAGTAAVALRAQSLRRRVYYRMDARRPPAAEGFRWPRALAAALVPEAGELGLLATALRPAAPRLREVVLPLRLQAAAAAGSRYDVVLMPGVEWRELRHAITRVDADGREIATVAAEQALGLGYYPADRAVVLPLPKALLAAGGLYRLDLAAEIEGGGNVARTVWFLHVAA